MFNKGLFKNCEESLLRVLYNDHIEIEDKNELELYKRDCGKILEYYYYNMVWYKYIYNEKRISNVIF